ncbi:MAG: glycosyltransferase family 39 protein [Betaproteobacteria bacterium]|nr:glycosyltransferase family 39 protein [Betaproteobacteria bacterium]
MPLLQILRCPERNTTANLLLIGFTVLSSLLLIANPGFFGQDELRLADHVLKHGLANFIDAYVKVRSGSEFGVPVRPVSFLFQGVVSLFIFQYPILAHLADVLMHALVACLFFVAICRLSGNRQLAWVSASIFIVSPLVAFSVGWTAALMDRLYILFGLIAFIAAHAYITEKQGKASLIAVFIGSALAILSKETAMILPASLGLLILLSQASIRNKRLWIALAIWSLPIVIFLLQRIPAILNTLSGNVSGNYSVSLTYIPESIFAYAIYPFFISLTEIHIWHFLAANKIWIAASAHCILLLLLWIRFSWRISLIYLFGYFIFLLPILPIQGKGAHYLYGSAMAFSVALAALLILKGARLFRICQFVVAVMLVAAISHTLVIQDNFYKTGQCMSRIDSSIQSAYLTQAQPKEMNIWVESGAPGHILHRYTFNKTSIVTDAPVTFKVFDSTTPEGEKIDYRLNKSCTVYARPSP